MDDHGPPGPLQVELLHLPDHGLAHVPTASVPAGEVPLDARLRREGNNSGDAPGLLVEDIRRPTDYLCECE